MRYNLIQVMTVLVVHSTNIIGMIPENGRVKVGAGVKALHELMRDDRVLSADNQMKKLSEQRASLSMDKARRNSTIQIDLGNRKINACPDQLFYDPTKKQWIRAENLNHENTLLDEDMRPRDILEVRRKRFMPMHARHVQVDETHQLFVDDVLVHNKGEGGGNAIWVIPILWEGLKFVGGFLKDSFVEGVKDEIKNEVFSAGMNIAQEANNSLQSHPYSYTHDVKAQEWGMATKSPNPDLVFQRPVDEGLPQFYTLPEGQKKESNIAYSCSAEMQYKQNKGAEARAQREKHERQNEYISVTKDSCYIDPSTGKPIQIETIEHVPYDKHEEWFEMKMREQEEAQRRAEEINEQCSKSEVRTKRAEKELKLQQEAERKAQEEAQRASEQVSKQQELAQKEEATRRAIEEERNRAAQQAERDRRASSLRTAIEWANKTNDGNKLSEKIFFKPKSA